MDFDDAVNDPDNPGELTYSEELPERDQVPTTTPRETLAQVRAPDQQIPTLIIRPAHGPAQPPN